ncbi:MAG: beta-N-acetylhexosaminidase [Akkermansia sp.]|nr:beta-N-acetylhexosaminidase [Akkermansia sp.]
MKIKHAILSLASALALMGFTQPCPAEWTSPIPAQAEANAPCPLLPFPQRVEWKQGTLAYGKVVNITGDAKGRMVKTASKALTKEAGEFGKGGAAPLGVALKIDPAATAPEHAAEGYRLRITAKGVQIAAAKEAGLFNGLQTLRQLVAGCRKGLPFCEIEDWPAFRMRGFMHDCGRNFQTIDSLKRQLELASRFKVNYFQWHLTDHPAWHVQCKCRPVLNDPSKRTRDAHDTYTYDQIRELFRYAADRNIQIIPELDMPGHSSYFDRCFGFKMHTEQGMKVLEELLDEFCKEVPQDICPIVHLGADEVRIPNAKEFVKRMSDFLIARGRIPAQWGGPRDLPVGEDSISQRWGEGGEMVEKSLKPETIKCHSFDSTIGYTNLFDPGLLVRRYFFMRPCGAAKGDELKMGVMICNWPDARVEDKRNIARHSAQWPGMLAMAERAWLGGEADGDTLPCHMPAADSPAGQAYARFEQRLMKMSCSILKGQPFPYWAESSVSWTVVGPVATAEADKNRDAVLKGEYGALATQPSHGANLYLRTKPNTGCLGVMGKVKPGNTVWAVTTIQSPKAGEMPFMIGFDAPARSSRRWSGVPQNGEWSQCGTRVWVNGREIKNPRRYKLAGQRQSKGDTWTSPLNEMPYDDEEIWWAQDPTKLPLKKGKNTIVIEQPYVGEYQSWGVSLIPLF